MIYIAVAIVLVAILFLIDRNHAWPRTWKIFKWTLAIVIALALLGAAGLYLYAKWDEAREKRESEARQAAYEKEQRAEAARKQQAIDNRWAEISVIQKDICGEHFIIVFGDDFPNSGEVACSAKRSETKYSEADYLSREACKIVLSKLPSGFTCHLAPVTARVAPRHIKALYSTELVTTPFGQLKCGSVDLGEIVTLIEESYGNVKVRRANGQVGWASESSFEVVR